VYAPPINEYRAPSPLHTIQNVLKMEKYFTVNLAILNNPAEK
jgi:hypothetical protein